MQSDGGRRLVGRVQRGLRRRYEQEIRRRFARIYYDRAESTWRDTDWLATPTWKLPSDLWVYQELIVRMRPDFIVETGTAYGGSALVPRRPCATRSTTAQVITVDTQKFEGRPEHPRIEYVFGSSTDPAFLEDVRRRTYGHSLMVILDSDHRKAHVLRRAAVVRPARAAEPLPRRGGHQRERPPGVRRPRRGSVGGGDDFLAFNHDFEIDGTCEKFLHTANPRGFLRRKVVS